MLPLTVSYAPLREDPMKRIATVFLSIAAVLLVGCGDGTGPGSSVAIKFRVAAPGAGAAASALLAPAACTTTLGENDITLACDNGTLTITDIRVIVEEFELEPVEVDECDDDSESADCADFEARFLFIQVPHGGQTVTAVTSEVPVGRYDELEFEVDDVEVDDDDPDDLADAELIEALFEMIRCEGEGCGGFPNWPAEASMVVVGTFAAPGVDPADATPFETYFEAEIEVELEFDTPLEVTAMGSADIVIEVMPEVWFVQGMNVMDLSLFNCDPDIACPLIEFELEIEDGFDLEIED